MANHDTGRHEASAMDRRPSLFIATDQSVGPYRPPLYSIYRRTGIPIDQLLGMESNRSWGEPERVHLRAGVSLDGGRAVRLPAWDKHKLGFV